MNNSPVILSAALALFTGSLCAADDTSLSGLEVRYEYFQWQEFGDQGGQILEETGGRLGLMISREERKMEGPSLRGSALLYLGNVDYDGRSQAGEPVESTTEYYGTALDGVLEFAYESGEGVTVAPYAGGGILTWIRKLDETGGLTQNGYDEWWLTFYLQAGIGFRIRDDAGEWQGRAGMVLPLFTRVEYDFTLPDGSSGVSVTPDSDLGFKADIQYRRNGYRAGLFYEAWNYGRSETEITGGAAIHQPKSEQQSVGIQLGIDL